MDMLLSELNANMTQNRKRLEENKFPFNILKLRQNIPDLIVH